MQEGGLICLFLRNWNPKSDFIWPILFLHSLPERLPHLSQYQMTKTKYHQWYWCEVPCLPKHPKQKGCKQNCVISFPFRLHNSLLQQCRSWAYNRSGETLGRVCTGKLALHTKGGIEQQKSGRNIIVPSRKIIKILYLHQHFAKKSHVFYPSSQQIIGSE